MKKTYKSSKASVKSKGNISKIVILLFILLGFITSFFSGYYLKDMLKKEQAGIAENNLLQVNETAQNTTQDLSDQHYFEDSVMLIAKENPFISLILSVSRQQQINQYIQNTKVYLFDGTSWKKKSYGESVPDANIKNNFILNQWNETIDKSKVLNESINGEVMVDRHDIQFSTGTLNNEISIRSQPGNTKFMSRGVGTFLIDGKTYQAYVLYTKIYSFNAKDIAFYNDPSIVSSGLTTDWLAFWDDDGNFYQIDVADINHPTQSYDSHKIGIFEDNNGILAKTFDVTVTRDNNLPPKNYTITLGSPADKILKLSLLNSLDRGDGIYKWYYGHVKGTIMKNDGKNVKGVGIVEYIQN